MSVQVELRVAVVTPYYRESLEVLQLCHDSVRTQTYPCNHFLVADGVPRREAATWTAQHVTLPAPNRDDGNLPRCVGSLVAMKQGYDAIAFLDADNWYYPNHVESMVQLHRQHGAAVCTATRSLHRPDGSLMYVDRLDRDGRRHVDTSCMFLLSPAFRALPLWGMMPQQLSPTGDNIFWQALQARGLKTAHHTEPTVAYRTPYEVHFRTLGETAPAGCKTIEESTGKAQRWWLNLSSDVRQDWARYLATLAFNESTPSHPASVR